MKLATDFTDYGDFSREKAQKAQEGGVSHEFSRISTKPPQADWLLQDLQDDQDFWGAWRLAGIAGQHPVDQNRLFPFGASSFGPSRF